MVVRGHERYAGGPLTIGEKHVSPSQQSREMPLLQSPPSGRHLRLCGALSWRSGLASPPLRDMSQMNTEAFMLFFLSCGNEGGGSGLGGFDGMAFFVMGILQIYIYSFSSRLETLSSSRLYN